MVSQHGLGEKNDRRHYLKGLSTNHCSVAGNTLFKNHQQRIHTWKGPEDNGGHKTDYIKVHQIQTQVNLI